MAFPESLDSLRVLVGPPLVLELVPVEEEEEVAFPESLRVLVDLQGYRI